ncbi:hypothetical protein N7512_002293 [Penicillium capsulatum]|nr:hypothetical protein N7512_002293 [Penicillium capsulatum]
MHRAIAVAIALAWSLQTVAATDIPPLTFAKDGTFHITLFEDLHMGEKASSPAGPEQDAKSIAVMNRVLASEYPDLVVLNGDLITGDHLSKDTSTHYIDLIVQPLLDHNLTWAATYGNHDSAYNLDRDALLKREQGWPNSRTRKMVQGRDAGVTNYYLPIYASGDTDGAGAPEMLLWFFDSRGGTYYQEHKNQPTWVDKSVAEWFTKTNDELVHKYNKEIPSLIFVHIPTRVSLVTQTEIDLDPSREPGMNHDKPMFYQAENYCDDGRQNHKCKGGQDMPFVEAIANTTGVVGVISAHDHGLSWCRTWDDQLPGIPDGKGTKLCFGQHTGYGGYGSWIRGSRQIVLTDSKLADKDFDTWIRLETGEITGSVSLNSTYGQDQYPEIKDVKDECPVCDGLKTPNGDNHRSPAGLALLLLVFLMQIMI